MIHEDGKSSHHNSHPIQPPPGLAQDLPSGTVIRLEEVSNKVQAAADRVITHLDTPIWRQGWIGALPPTKCSMETPEMPTATDVAKETPR